MVQKYKNNIIDKNNIIGKRNNANNVTGIIEINIKKINLVVSTSNFITYLQNSKFFVNSETLKHLD